MIAYCQNCGAEVSEEQRFCRQCGTQVRAAQEAELPTRIFPSETTQAGTPSGTSGVPFNAPGVPFSTSRLPESHTNPVYQPRQTAPQPFGSQYTAQPLQQPLPPPRRSRAWIYILVCLGILGSIFVTLLIFASQNSLPERRVVIKNGPQQVSPPLPPGALGQPGSVPVDESGAEVTDNETVIERSFPLQQGAAVSLKNVSGDIQIEGWDENRAEIKIIKHGGSAEEREAVPITQMSAGNRLLIETPMTANTPVQVQYEIKLPRGVGAVAISSLNSDIKLSEIDGAIAVDVKNGSIELQEIGGAIKAQTVKGDIKAELPGTVQKGSREFSTVKGDIELQLDGEVNADVRAETMSGKIDLDDDFNLKVEKPFVGQHVAGRVGSGGQTLSARTVNGSITLKK